MKNWKKEWLVHWIYQINKNKLSLMFFRKLNLTSKILISQFLINKKESKGKKTKKSITKN